MVNGIVPETFGYDAIAHCLTLYDWDCDADESWIEMVERVFSALGSAPAQVTANLAEKTIYGGYVRTRKRLISSLEHSRDYGKCNVRIRSNLVHDDGGGSPSDYQVDFWEKENKRKALCIAARHGSISSADHLMNLVGEITLSYTGACYGAAFDFPASYDPESYLCSVGFIPKGGSFMANKAHSERINRWSKRATYGELSPRAGYFREIYEINLLNDAHFNKPFKNGLFGDFAKSVGAIHPLPYCEGMYRWDVPRDKLQKVQELMESSDLVLSS